MDKCRDEIILPFAVPATLKRYEYLVQFRLGKRCQAEAGIR
jgi:hypothetical protein